MKGLWITGNSKDRGLCCGPMVIYTLDLLKKVKELVKVSLSRAMDKYTLASLKMENMRMRV